MIMKKMVMMLMLMLMLLLMMMMMMMMMNSFCGMVDRRKALSPISSRHHYHGPSRSQISDTPRAIFESAENLSSDFDE